MHRFLSPKNRQSLRWILGLGCLAIINATSLAAVPSIEKTAAEKVTSQTLQVSDKQNFSPIVPAKTSEQNTEKRVMQGFDELKAELVKSLQENELPPGLMLTLVNKEGVLWQGGVGYADKENKQRVNENTLFRMASVTKSFTALAILKLVEEGKLSLDEKLSTVAPEIPFKNPWEATQPVRIIHLLEHTAGFDDMPPRLMYNTQNKKEKSIQELIKDYSSDFHSRQAPGLRHSYSNADYILLGYLIEKLTGQNYEDYIRRVVFQPLAMTRSHLEWTMPREQADNYATGYGYDNSTGRVMPIGPYTLNLATAGNINSSAHDMANFVRMLLNNGVVDGKQVFAPEIIRSFETSESSLASRAGFRTHAKGSYLLHSRNKFRFQGHSGGLNGFMGEYGYNRELGIGYAFAGNSRLGMPEYADRIVNYLTNNFPRNPPPAAKVDPLQYSRYLGYYEPLSIRNELTGFMDEIADTGELYIDHGVLYFKTLSEEPKALAPVSTHLLRRQEGYDPIIFLHDDTDGQAMLTNILGQSYRKISYPYFVLSRYGLLATAFFALTIVPVFLGCLLLVGFKKLKGPRLRYRLVPFLAVASLFCALLGFKTLFDDHQDQFGTINIRTLAVFVGTSLFAIFSVLSLFYAIKMFKQYGKSNRYYMLVQGSALCIGMIYLLSHGVIFLRLWSY